MGLNPTRATLQTVVDLIGYQDDQILSGFARSLPAVGSGVGLGLATQYRGFNNNKCLCYFGDSLS